MLIIAKIFATVLSILVIARSIIDYRDKKESLQMTIFWVVIWVVIMAIAFFPSLIDKFVQLSGGNRTGLGTVLGMGLVFVMFITYRIYVKANRVEKNVAKLSRALALQQLKNSKK